MTVHSTVKPSPRKGRPTNAALFARVQPCTSVNSKGFERAYDAAIELLNRAISDVAESDEARTLLNSLTLTQRKLFGLPDFLMEGPTNA